MHQCCFFACGTVSKFHLIGHGSPGRRGRRGRRATLADSASDLPSIILSQLAFKSSGALHPSHARLRLNKNYALRPLRESDKLGKQMALARCASHQQAALMVFTSAVMHLKNPGKYFIRRILVT